ncbi:MAG: hypothetical protein KME17_03115 [Cyanosarcina radialis HA8281-LM2]|nr:hypothetical protein [Cyanosarcina radialis HA8281-LM2]
MGVLQALLLRKYNISIRWILASILAPLVCTPIFIGLAMFGLLSCCYGNHNPLHYTITLSLMASISGFVFAFIQAKLALWRFSRKRLWIIINGLGFALLAQVAVPHDNAVSIFGTLSNLAWFFSAVGFGFIQATTMAWLLSSEINNH